MTYLLSIDPGKSTGIFLGEYDDDSPLSRIGAWQFSGGLSGFLRWKRDHTEIDYGQEVGWNFYDVEIYQTIRYFHDDIDIIAEKFTPLNMPGFSHTLDSVEPLRIEGALVAMGLLPDYGSAIPSWQRPEAQYAFVSGESKEEKRKKAKEFLKQHDLYLTGKDVGQKDAEDAISATLHALTWLKRQKHMPTLRQYWPET